MTTLGDTTSTSQSVPPPASRATTPGWRDPRLWVGVVIVALSVVAGSRLLAAADESVPVWAVTSDMAPGDRVTAADLVARHVRFVDESDLSLYYPTDHALPGDLRLLQPVGVGELLPRSATGTADQTGVLHLPVQVEPGAVPPDVGAGSVVDVYLQAEDRCPACVDAALESVTVVTAPAPDELTGTQQLVLAVTQQQADRWFSLLARVPTSTATIVGRG